MGNWSPYSEEWEKQHLKKIMNETEPARVEFEKKPWIYKAAVRLDCLHSKRYVLLLFHQKALLPSVHFQEGALHSNQRRAAETIIATFFFS